MKQLLLPSRAGTLPATGMEEPAAAEEPPSHLSSSLDEGEQPALGNLVWICLLSGLVPEDATSRVAVGAQGSGREDCSEGSEGVHGGMGL